MRNINFWALIFLVSTLASGAMEDKKTLEEQFKNAIYANDPRLIDYYLSDKKVDHLTMLIDAQSGTRIIKMPPLAYALALSRETAALQLLHYSPRVQAGLIDSDGNSMLLLATNYGCPKVISALCSAVSKISTALIEWGPRASDLDENTKRETLDVLEREFKRQQTPKKPHLD